MSGALPRRIRRSSRVLLVDHEDRMLLFRFTPEGTPPFWLPPGGECDPGEDFPQAARRELFEETGIVADPDPLNVARQYDYIFEGEPVRALEQYFLHRTQITRIDTSGHTELEKARMQEHRWFTLEELPNWTEAVYPTDLADLLSAAFFEHS